MRPTRNKALANPNRMDTRTRLLESAGVIFARDGFQAASLRPICSLAKANVGLVNYYFGDKERLYNEVVRYSAYCIGAEDFPAAVALAGQLPPEVRLRHYIETFMTRMLDPERPAWHRKLLARELVDPSGLMNRLARETFTPHFKLLFGIVKDCLPKHTPIEQTMMCAGSILGQMLFYQHSRSYIEHVVPKVRYTPQQIQVWACHIYEFSRAALQNVPARKTRKRKAGSR